VQRGYTDSERITAKFHNNRWFCPTLVYTLCFDICHTCRLAVVEPSFRSPLEHTTIMRRHETTYFCRTQESGIAPRRREGDTSTRKFERSLGSVRTTQHLRALHRRTGDAEHLGDARAGVMPQHMTEAEDTPFDQTPDLYGQLVLFALLLLPQLSSGTCFYMCLPLGEKMGLLMPEVFNIPHLPRHNPLTHLQFRHVSAQPFTSSIPLCRKT
jgi:hypothetical protein